MTTINGLTLPRQLDTLLSSGRWRTPDQARLTRIFGESSTHASFYGLEAMQRENREWPQETIPDFLGAPSSSHPPGDIDPRRSVLIGDLGHDVPFALDYRTLEADPAVVFLATRTPGWITIAPTFSTFVANLGL